MVYPLGLLTLSSGAFILGTHTKSPPVTITVFAIMWYAFWSPVYGFGDYSIMQFNTNTLCTVVVWSVAGWCFSCNMGAVHMLNPGWWSKPRGKSFTVLVLACTLALMVPYVFIELWKYMPMWATALLTVLSILAVHFLVYFIIRDQKVWGDRSEANTFYFWHCIYLAANGIVYCICQNTMAGFTSAHWDMYTSLITAGAVVVSSYAIARFVFPRYSRLSEYA